MRPNEQVSCVSVSPDALSVPQKVHSAVVTDVCEVIEMDL